MFSLTVFSWPTYIKDMLNITICGNLFTFTPSHSTNNGVNLDNPQVT
jgi:hypothetical protein